MLRPMSAIGSVKLPKIPARQLYWLAGLLEGEGCFSEQTYHKCGSHWRVLPSIELIMTDRDVVVRAGAMIGGAQRRVRSYPGTGSNKRTHRWRVNGARAAHVMKTILPLMGQRRSRRINKILVKYERSGGRATRPPKSVKYRVSRESHLKYHREFARKWRRKKKAAK